MLVEYKKAHGSKVIIWEGFVNGKCLPVVWFEASKKSDVYLSIVVQESVWDNIKKVATRRPYWFQQDGVSCHVIRECLEFHWLNFGDRIISRNAEYI